MPILFNTPPGSRRQGDLVRISFPTDDRSDFLLPLEVFNEFCAAAETEILAPWRAEQAAAPGEPD